MEIPEVAFLRRRSDNSSLSIAKYHAIEAPKGELGFMIESDGTGHPWRAHLNSPSFTNLQGLESMLEGAVMGDMVILIGTIDPVMGEADK